MGNEAHDTPTTLPSDPGGHVIHNGKKSKLRVLCKSGAK
jgi:hypothetical protein